MSGLVRKSQFSLPDGWFGKEIIGFHGVETLKVITNICTCSPKVKRNHCCNRPAPPPLATRHPPPPPATATRHPPSPPATRHPPPPPATACCQSGKLLPPATATGYTWGIWGYLGPPGPPLPTTSPLSKGLCLPCCLTPMLFGMDFEDPGIFLMSIPSVFCIGSQPNPSLVLAMVGVRGTACMANYTLYRMDPQKTLG